MKKIFLVAAVLCCTLFSSRLLAQPFIGEIKMFAGNYAPQGWAFCNGQLLPINQNQALFAILGTTYGGNGQTNFALPDLRGRVPVHFGSGPGLQPYTLGQTGGSEYITLLTSNLPPHSHPILAETAAGTTASPVNAYMANTGAVDREYAATFNTTMGSTGSTGGALPVPIVQPYTTVNFIIALQGVFPPQQ